VPCQRALGCTCYNSFVFSDARGKWNSRFCGNRRTWLTSAKGGGFRPAGLWHGRLGTQRACEYRFKKYSGEPASEHFFSVFRLGKTAGLGGTPSPTPLQKA
jgi:hypothetical protein